MTEIFVPSTYETEVQQIVGDVFHAMLHCDAQPTTESSAAGVDLLTATVFFAGTWDGAVLVECPAEAAMNFAALLLRLPWDGLTAEDARDALGEIVNMIGGNLKSVLPHGVTLSLPMVVNGRDYGCKICAHHRRETFRFRSPAGRFAVTLVQIRSAR